MDFCILHGRICRRAPRSFVRIAKKHRQSSRIREDCIIAVCDFTKIGENKMESIQVKRVSDTARLPARATQGSAGYDLYADCFAEILPGEIVRVKTGIAIAIPANDVAAFIYARSGIAASFGVSPANCVGVVDSDYRGEIIVPLFNHGDTPFLVEPGDRIAQMVFAPVFLPKLVECDTLDETARGNGGFGSTGKGVPHNEF